MAYNFNFTKAQAGQIADSSVRIIDTYLLEPIQGLGFAMPVSIKTDGTCSISTNNENIDGVTVFSPEQFDPDLGLVQYYRAGDPVSVLKLGRIWVVTQVDVTLYNQKAYVDDDALFTTVSVGNRLAGIFLNTAKAGELIVLNFNSDVLNIN